ncbi:MBL fold metallo-hydrolase [Candidatus Woesearchaeota archaeon]|nr:MBL fold metallo-hydrolase [Candidatus Woesearchaeota archaeon]
MTLEVIPIGGFSEIGRNCVAVKHDDEIVILDLGLMMDHYIELTESDDIENISGKKLIEGGAAPDINILKDLKKHVVGICISHGHLDHAGAIPFLANRFDADIHATKMTCEVIRNLTDRDRKPIKNKLESHPVNCRFKLTRKIEIEFIYMTHSIPQTVGIIVHTKEGSVAYLNDFKFDASPTMGPKSNIARIKELKGIKCLIVDCLYADKEMKAQSEKIAQQMLYDQLLNTDTDGRAVVITTFASHIARLKTITKLGQKMGRKVVFLGRSLAKYVHASEQAGVADFSDVNVIPYRVKIDSWLKDTRDYSKYLMVMTGHQGEPKAVLSRTLNTGLLRLKRDDIVVFSSKTIPVDVNIENRKKLDDHLKHNRIRIFSDIHVSGHGAREDHRDLLTWMKPEHLIPVHGGMKQLGAMKELAVYDLKYKPEKVHVLYNGQSVKLA